jgi:SAM-dependent methyltransferase
MSPKLIHDHGRSSDWGLTSTDYARFRPGYPSSFFQRIVALGIGLPGQRVLDLGTGTGNIARALLRLGCVVTGVDISEQQIVEARRLALEEGLTAEFLVRPAEETGLPDASFDVITAAQSFLYFDRDSAVAEIKRLLAIEGRFMTCHLGWLPRKDPIAKQTEELVLKHNPDWTAADYTGEVPANPGWIGNDFRVVAFFVYEEPIPFTRESWRGRIRACRGVGASLREEQVAAFDREHAQLLARNVPEEFTVLHWIDAHIMVPR